MFCSKCGKELVDNDQFCTECGQSTNQQNFNEQYNNQSYSCCNDKFIRPENYLIWAILVTLFCCLPFGIISIIKSCDVNTKYDKGQYLEAEAASRSARNWALWGALSSVIGAIIYIIFVLTVGVNLTSMNNF